MSSISPDVAVLAETVRRSAQQGTMAHAYVVSGAARAPAIEFALALIGYLYCPSGNPPCGECAVCRRISNRSHPDVKWIEPQLKSRQIGIDDIHDLVRNISHSAFEGGWKVAVLLDADRMNEKAANALLKTLEEPPANTLFLLITESPQVLMDTIVSRCQRINIAGAETVPEIEGLPRMLELLTQQSSIPLYRHIVASEIEAILDDKRSEFTAAEKALQDEEGSGRKKEQLEARIESRVRALRSDLLKIMVLWNRDVMMLVCGVSEESLHFREHVGPLKTCAAKLDFSKALSNVRAIQEISRRLDRNIGLRYAVAAGLAKIG